MERGGAVRRPAAGTMSDGGPAESTRARGWGLEASGAALGQERRRTGVGDVGLGLEERDGGEPL
jgi:hypothetical protein